MEDVCEQVVGIWLVTICGLGNRGLILCVQEVWILGCVCATEVGEDLRVRWFVEGFGRFVLVCECVCSSEERYVWKVGISGLQGADSQAVCGKVGGCGLGGCVCMYVCGWGPGRWGRWRGWSMCV